MVDSLLTKLPCSKFRALQSWPGFINKNKNVLPLVVCDPHGGQGRSPVNHGQCTGIAVRKDPAAVTYKLVAEFANFLASAADLRGISSGCTQIKIVSLHVIYGLEEIKCSWSCRSYLLYGFLHVFLVFLGHGKPESGSDTNCRCTSDHHVFYCVGNIIAVLCLENLYFFRQLSLIDKLDHIIFVPNCKQVLQLAVNVYFH